MLSSWHDIDRPVNQSFQTLLVLPKSFSMTKQVSFLHNQAGSFGTVFIVDISGYSRFVMDTALSDGVRIIESLLEALLPDITGLFQISEIEGDAVLYYSLGIPIPVCEILAQFRKMLHDFDELISMTTERFPQVAELTIKLVVHYGPLIEYSVGGFKKLYGSTVVEAHRLLKNHVDCHTYALITEAYFKEQAVFGISFPETGNFMYDVYDVGKVNYVLFKSPFV